MPILKRKIKIDDPTRAYDLAARFCAYRERSIKELKKLLAERTALEAEQEEQIVAQLIAEGYLDETRFAGAFVRGKFTTRQWGRLKIREGMRHLGVSDEQINEALSQELNEEQYLDSLRATLSKKLESIPEKLSSTEKYRKLLQYALQKGYEAEIVRKVLPEIQQFKNS